MKVENYGDLISKVTGKPLIAYVEFGSYQGDYITVLDDGENIELWKGSYGSCSGCDWLEAERDWGTYEVPDEKVKEYMGSDRPFALIPKETVMRVDADTFAEMLPANTRSDIYYFESERFHAEVLKGLTPPTTEELLELNEPPIKASKNSCVDCGISVEPYEAQCSDCRRQV